MSWPRAQRGRLRRRPGCVRAPHAFLGWWPSIHWRRHVDARQAAAQPLAGPRESWPILTPDPTGGLAAAAVQQLCSCGCGCSCAQPLLRRASARRDRFTGSRHPPSTSDCKLRKPADNRSALPAPPGVPLCVRSLLSYAGRPGMAGTTHARQRGAVMATSATEFAGSSR
jgi:hypothetical protein